MSVSWALVNRVPRKFGIGLALRHTISLRIQKSASWSSAPTRIDIVVAADHPDRAVILEDTPRLLEPLPREIIVGREALEFVPFVINRVDPASLRSKQIASKLQIIGRVRKDHVDALGRQPRHFGHAIAVEDRVERKLALARFRQPRSMPAASAMRAMRFMRCLAPPLARSRVSQRETAVKQSRVNQS